jgi:two-component system, sensor histidine kinase YesM
MRGRILLFFMLMSTLTVLVVSITFYRISFDVIRSKASQFNRQIIENVTEKIDALLGEALQTAHMIADDPAVQATLRKAPDPDVGRRYSKELELDTQLAFVQSYTSDVFCVSVVGANGSTYRSAFYTVKAGDLRQGDWYRTIVASRAPVWFGSHDGAFAVETTGQPLFSVGVPIMDKATGNSLGVVVADTEVQRILDTIRARLGETGFIFIVDAHHNVISHPDNLVTSEKEAVLRRAVENYTRQGGVSAPPPFREEFLFFSKESAVTGWNIIGAIPMTELTKDTTAIGTTISILLLAACLFDILAALYFAGTITRPVNQLMLLMEKVRDGDFSVEMRASGRDEIGRLAESFTLMVERIRELMGRVQDEHQKLRAAELLALEAQINPHFLYNTLDSIIWLSRVGRSADVIRLVTAMTRLFRIGISNGREIISIGDELEHVRSYLTIQEIRYKDKMDYRIDVPPELHGHRILKLVLQPLVENAIYHGIKNVRGKGSITVNGRTENGDILLSVSDSGIGMSGEQVDALRRSLAAPGTAEDLRPGYGLKNVHERLTLFFGAGYGLSFESEAKRGTTVSVRIPKSKENADHGIPGAG